MALNLTEGVFLILHLDFSVGVWLGEQVMGPKLCLLRGAASSFVPAGTLATINCDSLVSAVVGNQ